MPDPKITKEKDMIFYPLLQQKALQYREMLQRVNGNDELSLPGEDDGEPGTVKSVYSEMRRSLQNVCQLDFNKPENTDAFTESWNKFVDAVNKLNGYRDGRYNPDRELSRKVHAVYEQQDYGSMADDPNCEKLLTCANTCCMIHASLQNLHSTLTQYRTVEPYQECHSLDEEMDVFFRGVYRNPDLKRVFTEKDAYTNEMSKLNTALSQLQQKLDMTDAQLEELFLQEKEKELPGQLLQVENDYRKNAGDMENAAPKLTMEARIDAYKREVTLQNENNERENAKIQSSNNVLDQEIRQVENSLKADREKLENELSREAFLEAQEAKDQQTADGYRKEAQEHREKETGLVDLVIRMQRRKDMMDALGSIPKETLEEYSITQANFNTLKRFRDAALKDNNAEGLPSLKGVASLYENRDKDNVRKLMTLRKDAEDAARGVGKNAGKAKAKFDELDKQLSKNKVSWAEFDTFCTLDSILEKNPGIKADVDKRRKEYPSENIMYAVSSVYQKYDDNLSRIYQENEAYFSAREHEKEYAEILDQNGNHYEYRLDEIKTLNLQAEQERELAKKADNKLNYDFEAERRKAAEAYRTREEIEAQKKKLTEEAEKKTRELRSRKKQLKDIVQIPGDEDLKKIMEQNEETDRKKRAEELENAIKTAKQNKQKELFDQFKKNYRAAAIDERSGLRMKQKLLQDKSSTFQKLYERTKKLQANNTELKNKMHGTIYADGLWLENDMMNNVKTYLENIDKGRRPLHKDSKEFTDMRKELNELRNLIWSEKGWHASPAHMKELIVEKLTTLRDAADHYQDVKRRNDHHIVKDSNMRRLRLNFADGLKAYCSAALQEMQVQAEVEKSFMEKSSELLQSTAMNISTESPAAFLNAGLQKQAQPQKVNAEPAANQKNKAVAAAPSKKNAGPVPGKH